MVLQARVELLRGRLAQRGQIGLNGEVVTHGVALYGAAHAAYIDGFLTLLDLCETAFLFLPSFPAI